MGVFPLPSLELIIPLYNEQEVVDPLIARLTSTFSPEALAKHNLASIHFIFVDDGSRDQTAERIRDAISRGLCATLYRLSRNFGHQSAVTAGLNYAAADLVAVIDADLQDPPEVVLRMVEKAREGFQVVFGQRTKRKEGLFKKSCYWAFYRLFSLLAEVEVGIDSGDFCLMDKRVVEAMRALPERARFPRLLRSWVGFSQTGLTYERAAREAGITKYSFVKLYKLATDGIASASVRPLRIAQFFCILFAVLSFCFLVVSLKKYLSYSDSGRIAIWFYFTYFLISLSSFMIMLILYVISAYVGRTYIEVKGRPSYILSEVIRNEEH